MKKIIFILVATLGVLAVNAQVVSMRVVQGTYSAADPDGAGPATGSVTIRFEVMSTVPVLADGIGLSAVYQSSLLMATPTNTTVILGPLAAAAGWTQQVDNRAGLAITPVVYGGQSFDTRMIVTFNQAQGTPNALIGTSWTAIAEITYWTKGGVSPQGGYIVNQPGSVVAQNELSSDGGLSTYPLESPFLNTPTPLGSSGTTPVTFTRFDAKCNGNGTLISWSTAQESNSRNFEIQKSANGTTWETVATVAAAGNSASHRNYQQLDLAGGTAMYRIKQVDQDGRFIYTSVERTNCETRNISSVIYPVPARDILNVVIRSDRSAKTQLMVYETSGKLVRKVDVSVVNGNNTFKINTTGLASGDYMIRSSNADIDLNKVFTIVN
jgi:hypothetical protein